MLLCLAHGACASDTTVDLSVSVFDGRPLGPVQVVVCDARDRSYVLDAVLLDPGGSSTIRLPADGRAVAFAASTVEGLCAASCQLELQSDATITGSLVLYDCLPCPRAELTAENVCRDPLCFLESASLSACE